MDIGATHYMSPHIDCMIDVIDLNLPISVRLPNGSMVRVKQMGTVELKPGFMVQNVLHVPEF